MNTKLQEVLEEARQLPPLEQLDLIRALSESLHAQYRDGVGQPSTGDQDTIPNSVRRTKPATNLEDYAADFWPDDESVDEFNAYIKQQRSADRLSDQ